MLSLDNSSVGVTDYVYSFDGSGADSKYIELGTAGSTYQVVEADNKVEMRFNNGSRILRGKGETGFVGEYNAVEISSSTAQTVRITLGNGLGISIAQQVIEGIKVDDDGTQAAITSMHTQLLAELIKPNARTTTAITDVTITTSTVTPLTTANGQYEQIIQVKDLPNFASGAEGYILVGSAADIAANRGIKLYKDDTATLSTASALSVYTPALDFASGDVIIGGLEVV